MSQHQHDDGARPAQRHSGTRGAQRVTFGPFALLVGTGVTHLLLVLVIAVTLHSESAWHTFTMAVMTAIAGIPLAVIGCVLALALGLALRSMGNQILHVTAFFGTFALLSALITLIAGGGGLGALLTGAVIGTAAAVGRASVWKLVTIHPQVAGTGIV